MKNPSPSFLARLFAGADLEQAEQRLRALEQASADTAAKHAQAVARLAEVEAELRRIGHELSPFDIVLVNTAAGARYGQPDYVMTGCGMGREATLYLLERGVRVTGTDAWSWDAPFIHTAKRWMETHDPAIIWEGHRASMEIGYCHMEKLSNLESLPPNGFTVSCFPVKIKGASAGFTRAVAILED